MRKRNVGALLVAVALVMLCSEQLVAQGQGRGQRGQRGGAQRQGGRTQRGFGGGFAGFGGSSRRDMAARTDVAKELGLLEDQTEQIEELRREYFTARRDAFQDAGNDRDKMRAALEKVSKEYDSKLDDILLPHQAKRLTQLTYQYQIRQNRGGSRGTARFLAGEDVSTKLKISEAQKKELTEKAEELNKEMEEKIAKLRAEAQAELLSVLSGPQRSQYKDMIGDPFEFAQTQRTGGFGGQFGRGGRGQQGRGGQSRGRGGQGRGGQGGRPQRDDME